MRSNPLYNMKSKKKIARILLIDYIGYNIHDYDFFNNYNIFIKTSGTNSSLKKRLIEAPLGKLKDVHKRIFNFLNMIKLPEYYMSKRRSSYIDNHRPHKNSKYFYSIDISNYFINCSFKQVFDFFSNKLNMSKDVAIIISKLVTVDYKLIKLTRTLDAFIAHYKTENKYFEPVHIPTGSSLSAILAFLSYQDMFDELYSLAIENTYTMTVYVDDINFSSQNPISKAYMSKVNKIVRKYGHNIKKSKKKYLDNTKHKNVTGVIITPDNKVKIPNKLHYKYKKFKKKYLENPTPKNKQKLNGIKNSMDQIRKLK